MHDMPIETLTLLPRTRATLKRHGITEIGDLTSRTAMELLEIPGFFHGGLGQVVAELSMRGLALRKPTKKEMASWAK